MHQGLIRVQKPLLQSGVIIHEADLKQQVSKHTAAVIAIQTQDIQQKFLLQSASTLLLPLNLRGIFKSKQRMQAWYQAFWSMLVVSLLAC